MNNTQFLFCTTVPFSIVIDVQDVQVLFLHHVEADMLHVLNTLVC